MFLCFLLLLLFIIILFLQNKKRQFSIEKWSKLGVLGKGSSKVTEVYLVKTTFETESLKGKTNVEL